MTIWRMSIAWRVTKFTDTHSEYVMQTALPLQQWLGKLASMLRYTYIFCLVYLQNTQYIGTYVRALPFKPITNVRKVPTPIDSPSNTSRKVYARLAEHPVVYIDLQYEPLLQHLTILVTSWTPQYSWPHLLTCLASDGQTAAPPVLCAADTHYLVCAIGYQRSQLEHLNISKIFDYKLQVAIACFSCSPPPFPVSSTLDP